MGVVATLLPAGTGTLNQFAVFGTRPTAIQTADAASTYVWSRRDFAKTDRILMDDLPAAAASVSLVRVQHQFRQSGTGDACLERAGFFEGSPVWGPQRATGGWVTATDTIALAPGSVPWTVANVNSAQLTCHEDGSSSSSNAVEISMYKGLITYDAGGGGLIHLLADVVLPILGAAVPLSAMRELAAMTNQATRCLIEPNSYRRAHAELVGYTRPVHIFL